MKKIFFLFLGILLTHQAFCTDTSSGCGVGWYLLKQNSLLSSSLRSTTNAVFLNTVGMTFGTSNCAKHDIVKNDKKSLHFTEQSITQLTREMAQGKGAYLYALGDFIGCGANLQQFSMFVKSRYNNIIPSKETHSVNVLNNLLRQLAESNFGRQCTLIQS